MKRTYYGWVIIIASMVLSTLGLGMYVSTNSVFVKPICESLGFARGEFTLHRTIITLVAAALMPLFGGIIQRVGVKKVLLTSALTLGLVAIAYSFASQLWHFYLIAVINGLFYSGISFMSIGVLVNAWFDGKRGLASGLAYAGSGIGGALMVPLIGRVIENMGWRFAYQLMGGIGLAIMLPVIAVFIKNQPADMGLEPYPADTTARHKAGSADMSFRDATRTKTFWTLMVAFFFINFFAACTNTHSAPYLSDIGYSAEFTSSVISLFMLFLTIGKIILGLIYDRFGVRAGNAMIMAFCLVFPVCALLAGHPVVPWVYAVTVGMASCAVSVPLPILLMRHFGQRDFPLLFSFSSMLGSLAASLSVPAMGAVYDMTGSYRFAWIGLMAFSVIITASLISTELIGAKGNGA